jgi:outer membrane receptor protein involved in Fe transport
VNPVDLRALSPLLPPALQPAVANPFPLVVRAVGSEGAMSFDRAPLKEESLTAYELAYTGTLRNRTTIGAAFYVNDLDNSINLVQLPPTVDPYSSRNPPPGWLLPPFLLDVMAQADVFLPRTAFTYMNLGPLRQRGVELSLDHHVSRAMHTFVNYSWQGRPGILPAPNPYPFTELDLPPTHRFNIGISYGGTRFIGSVSANHTARAFWSDVLTSEFHGYSDPFTLVNGSVGVRWHDGRLTTTVKSMNMLNQQVQQHVFGDVMKRSVTSELALRF